MTYMYCYSKKRVKNPLTAAPHPEKELKRAKPCRDPSIDAVSSVRSTSVPSYLRPSALTTF